MDEHDAVAVVSGANSPLGSDIVGELSIDHAVVGLVRPSSDLTHLQTLGPRGKLARLFSCDLGSLEQVLAVLRQLSSAHERCDLLVNVACGWIPGDMQSISEESIYEVVAGSVSGTLVLTRNLLPLLRRAPSPRIVNICSTVGTGYRFSPNTLYVTLKGAVDAFGRSLRNELLGTGVLVTNLHLGRFEDGEPANHGLVPVRDISRMIRVIVSMGLGTSVDSVTITPAGISY